MTENQRLKLVMNSLGFRNQKEFADALAIKQGSLSDILRGKEGVGVSAAIKRTLELEYSINIKWLETGEGDMQMSPPSDSSTTSTAVDSQIEVLVRIIDKMSDNESQNSRNIETMNENIKELIAQGRDQVDNMTKLVDFLCKNGISLDAVSEKVKVKLYNQNENTSLIAAEKGADYGNNK